MRVAVHLSAGLRFQELALAEARLARPKINSIRLTYRDGERL